MPLEPQETWQEKLSSLNHFCKPMRYQIDGVLAKLYNKLPMFKPLLSLPTFSCVPGQLQRLSSWANGRRILHTSEKTKKKIFIAEKWTQKTAVTQILNSISWKQSIEHCHFGESQSWGALKLLQRATIPT